MTWIPLFEALHNMLLFVEEHKRENNHKISICSSLLLFNLQCAHDGAFVLQYGITRSAAHPP